MALLIPLQPGGLDLLIYLFNTAIVKRNYSIKNNNLIKK